MPLRHSGCVRSVQRSNVPLAYRGASSPHRLVSDPRTMTEPTGSEERPALALQGIDKQFGATRALMAASLRVRPGTVHALLGENGAGKSTRMRIAYGMERPDAGTIQVRGTTVRLDSPSSAIALGVGMVHQHFTLVPVMTVA